MATQNPSKRLRKRTRARARDAIQKHCEVFGCLPDGLDKIFHQNEALMNTSQPSNAPSAITSNDEDPSKPKHLRTWTTQRSGKKMTAGSAAARSLGKLIRRKNKNILRTMTIHHHRTFQKRLQHLEMDADLYKKQYHGIKKNAEELTQNFAQQVSSVLAPYKWGPQRFEFLEHRMAAIEEEQASKLEGYEAKIRSLEGEVMSLKAEMEAIEEFQDKRIKTLEDQLAALNK